MIPNKPLSELSDFDVTRHGDMFITKVPGGFIYQKQHSNMIFVPAETMPHAVRTAAVEFTIADQLRKWVEQMRNRQLKNTWDEMLATAEQIERGEI